MGGSRWVAKVIDAWQEQDDYLGHEGGSYGDADSVEVRIPTDTCCLPY